MKVSVLIPVFNRESYLSESIQSVLSQSFNDFEIIVIDDGSSDESLQIAKYLALKDNRIRVVSKENGGRASAINFGLNYANGEYITFLDSDDLMSENRLKLEVEFLDHNQDIDLVYGDMEKFWSDGKREIRQAVEFEDESSPLKVMKLFFKNGGFEKVPPHLLYSNSAEGKAILGGSVMIRRKVFDKGIRLDSNLKNIEDTDLWLKIIGNGYKVKRIPEIMFLYRIHESQKSSNPEKMAIASKIIYNKLKSGEYFLKPNNIK